MRRLGLGRAQFAVGVDAARQQVVQQTLLDGLELGDDRLGFVDGGVEGVEDLGDNWLGILACNWNFKSQIILNSNAFDCRAYSLGFCLGLDKLQ